MKKTKYRQMGDSSESEKYVSDLLGMLLPVR